MPQTLTSAPHGSRSRDTPRGQAMRTGARGLETLAPEAEAEGLMPQPRSSQQERLEHLVNSCI